MHPITSLKLPIQVVDPETTVSMLTICKNVLSTFLVQSRLRLKTGEDRMKTVKLGGLTFIYPRGIAQQSQ